MTLRFNNIYKAYDKELFHGLTIHFGPIGLIGVVGASGSGKTTLIHCIGGLEEIDQGEITYGSLPIEKNKLFRKNNISYIYQFYNLLPALTIKENIEYGMYCKQQGIPNYQKIIQKLEISDLLDRYPSQLSGGQRQRVAIARAFLCDSPILLCDEPTGALHKKLAYQVMKLLEDYSKHHLVIVVSHDRSLIQQFTDKIIDFDDLSHHYYFSYRNYAVCNKKKYVASFFTTWKHCYRQFLYKKKTYFFLFILQAITITSFLLLLGAKSGIENYFNNSYDEYVTRNIVEVQKLDYINNDFSIEESEDIQEKYNDCSYDYNFLMGEYKDVEQAITTIAIPNQKEHIHLMTGSFPSATNEVLISNNLYEEYSKDTIIFSVEDKEYTFTIVGVIEDVMMNSYSVYYQEFYMDSTLLDTIENTTKVYLEVEPDQDIQSVVDRYNDDIYYSYSSYLDLKQGQESLFYLGQVVGYIFMAISFFISLLLIHLVFSALLYERKKDSAIAFSNGMSFSRLCGIYSLEGLVTGAAVAIGGIVLGSIVLELCIIIEPLQSIITIQPLFDFPNIVVFIIIFLLYSLSCSMMAFLVARKMASFRCSEVIKEE